MQHIIQSKTISYSDHDSGVSLFHRAYLLCWFLALCLYCQKSIQNGKFKFCQQSILFVFFSGWHIWLHWNSFSFQTVQRKVNKRKSEIPQCLLSNTNECLFIAVTLMFIITTVKSSSLSGSCGHLIDSSWWLYWCSAGKVNTYLLMEIQGVPKVMTISTNIPFFGIDICHEV